MVQRREFGQWILTFIVMAALVAGFAAVVWLFALAIREGATIVAAILAAFATVAAALIVRLFERRKEIEAARREHLGPLYVELGSVLAGHDLNQRKREKIILQFMKKSLMYAGPAVLKAFRDWRDALPDGEETEWPRDVARENALRYEAFVKAMRKDLGVSNWMLQEGDLARAVLRDFDQYFAEPRDLPVPPEPDGAEVRISATEASTAESPTRSP